MASPRDRYSKHERSIRPIGRREKPSAQLRVSGGVFDVGMAQPKLQPSGVMAGISQEMPACVPQHMRMHVREQSPITGRFNHLSDIKARHRAATLGGKHKGRLRFLIASELTQNPQFVALNRMDAVNAVFESSNVQMALGEVDLIPA